MGTVCTTDKTIKVEISYQKGLWHTKDKPN